MTSPTDSMNLPDRLSRTVLDKIVRDLQTGEFLRELCLQELIKRDALIGGRRDKLSIAFPSFCYATRCHPLSPTS